VWSYKEEVLHQWHNVCTAGCGYRGDNVESIVAQCVAAVVSGGLCYRWYGAVGRMGAFRRRWRALVLWDVAICVVAIVHHNADINMSGLGGIILVP